VIPLSAYGYRTLDAAIAGAQQRATLHGRRYYVFALDETPSRFSVSKHRDECPGARRVRTVNPEVA
jgi:hypothetical protein